MSPLAAAAIALVVVVTIVAVVLVRSRRASRAPGPPAAPHRPASARAAGPAAHLSLTSRLSRLSLRSLIGGLLAKDGLSEAEWEAVTEGLILADVGVTTAERLVAGARRDPLGGSPSFLLRRELLGIFGERPRSLARRASPPTVWLVTGVNGTGKTTTAGKLAATLTARGEKAMLAAADTFRAAAAEQLERWAALTGADIVGHTAGGDPGAVAFDALSAARARGSDAVIVDTAGRLHTKRGLMDELAKVARVLEREGAAPDEVLLVLDATTGQNGVAQARAFLDSVGITGVVLTKMDGTAKGGVVVAVEQDLGIPVKLVGVGEGPEDLLPFDPRLFLDALLGPLA